MPLDLSLLVKETLKVEGSDFVETVEKAKSLLAKEKGQIGNLTIIDRLVKLEALGDVLIIGDLHGDLESLILILQKSRYLEQMKRTDEATLIFLGDYGDRGEKSPETYYLILKLKLAFPKQTVLLRGNHEAPKDLLGVPHDLPIQFQNRFANTWQQAYEQIRSLHDCLYNALYVEGRYLMLHGGLSLDINSLQDIAQAQENHNKALFEELLWNDPDEKVPTVSFSPRGAGKLFGKKVTEEVLKRLNAKILIRGHEASNVGFKTNHNGKVLTLFSRKGEPYFNRQGAYLQLPLAEAFENAQQLMPFVHKF
jgi:diadenosine tetraphosphatase ApaH/serine/threonine PP2A family protein phosphatase